MVSYELIHEETLRLQQLHRMVHSLVRLREIVTSGESGALSIVDADPLQIGEGIACSFESHLPKVLFNFGRLSLRDLLAKLPTGQMINFCASNFTFQVAICLDFTALPLVALANCWRRPQ